MAWRVFEACQNLKGNDTPVTDDTTIIAFRQPGSINEPLTGITREGARRMLMAALKAASRRLCRAVFRRSACRWASEIGSARGRARTAPGQTG